MARYTEAKCRLCRRETMKLFWKGARCFTDKCAIERRNYPPGQHGLNRGKPTAFGVQLREKQKAKRIYGVLESQFRKYFQWAEREKGVTGENLLRLLELRLDNVVHRLSFADSRPERRQIVAHGHFPVSGRKASIPSFLVKVGDSVQLRPTSQMQARIDGVKSADAKIPGVKESTIDVLLNLKKLSIQVPSNEPKVLRLDVTGPKTVTGVDVPETDVEVVNPAVHLFTIESATRVAIELGVGTGRGYEAVDRATTTTPAGALAIDAAYSPITRVAYNVEMSRLRPIIHLLKISPVVG